MLLLSWIICAGTQSSAELGRSEPEDDATLMSGCKAEGDSACYRRLAHTRLERIQELEALLASCHSVCSNDASKSTGSSTSGLEEEANNLNDPSMQQEKQPQAASSHMASSHLSGLSISSFLVIHLERATERAALLKQDAAAQGIHVDTLVASDGRASRFQTSVFPSRHPNSTCGDIVSAIFDSHRRAWKAAAATEGVCTCMRPPDNSYPVLMRTNTGHTVIFEDDVMLPTNFAKILAKRFPGLPPWYDVAFLGTTTSRKARAYPGSKYLLRPDENNTDAILGNNVSQPYTRI